MIIVLLMLIQTVSNLMQGCVMHALGGNHCLWCSKHCRSDSQRNRGWHVAVRNVLFEAGDYACKADQWRHGKRAVSSPLQITFVTLICRDAVLQDLS
jgi:hypothetical protein